MDIISVYTGGAWTALPTPISYVVIPQSLSSSESTGRDVTGLLHVDRIAVKRTISIGWNALASSDFVRLCTLTGDVQFRVRYWDPTVGALGEGYFYRGNDFTYVPAGRFDESEGWALIESTSMTLTEV